MGSNCSVLHSEIPVPSSSKKQPAINENQNDSESCIHLLLGIPQAHVGPERCRFAVRCPGLELCIRTAPTLTLPELEGAVWYSHTWGQMDLVSSALPWERREMVVLLVMYLFVTGSPLSV